MSATPYAPAGQKRFFSKNGQRRSLNARVMAFASGKGGVGKTNIAINIAIILASLKKKVCFLDLDSGRANIGVMIGRELEFSLEPVLNGEKILEDVLADGPGGIKILSAAPCLEMLISSDQAAGRFLGVVEELEADFDYVIIDTSSHHSDEMFNFLLSAQDLIVIISPDLSSSEEAFLMMKRLKEKEFSGNIFTLTNLVLGYDDSLELFNHFNSCIRDQLELEINFLGYVPMEHGMISSAICQVPIIHHLPNAIQSRCLTSVAKKFESRFAEKGNGCFSEFWKEFAPQNFEEGRQNDFIGGLPEKVELAAKEQAESPAEAEDPMDESVGEVAEEPLADETNDEVETENADSLIGNAEPEDEDEPCKLESDDYENKEELIVEAETVPVPVQASLKDFPASEILAEVFENIENGLIPEDKLQDLCVKAEDSFVERFQRYPVETMDLFSSRINQDELSKDEFLELAEAVKHKYSEKFQEPLYNPDLLFSELIAGAKESQDKLRGMHQQVSETFQQNFNEPLLGLKDHLTSELGKGKFSEEEIVELIDCIKQAYLEHSGRVYKDQQSIEIEDELKNMLSKLDKFDQARTLVSEIIIESFDAQDDLVAAINDFIESRQENE